METEIIKLMVEAPTSVNGHIGQGCPLTLSNYEVHLPSLSRAISDNGRQKITWCTEILRHFQKIAINFTV